MIVFLDSGPLGLVTNPAAGPESRRCAAWIEALLAAKIRVVVPEIADYEVRRELVRAGRSPGIQRLDDLEGALEYARINTAAMRVACDNWARVRGIGKRTAPDKELDGDMILAAQASVYPAGGDPVTVATGNLRHLSLVTSAKDWRDSDWL